MLIFNRPNFCSGTVVVRGQDRKVKTQEYQYVPIIDVRGNPIFDGLGSPLVEAKLFDIERVERREYRFSPADNGREIDAGEDEEHLLQKYPLLFVRK